MEQSRKISKEIHDLLVRRKYNRGKPFHEEEISFLIDNAVENSRPIRLVGYWGTGPKSTPNWADTESCEFLNGLNIDIKKIYAPGIEFTFIFANLHGLHNGYSKDAIDSYISGMIEIFKEHDFKYMFLDALWNKYGISFEKIAQKLETMPKDWWNTVPQREMIEKNAAHRNRNSIPEVGAKKYYVMRELEKSMLEQEFKGYIFHAFSDPRLQIVLPNMPTLYFYGRESWSNAPWFVDSEKS